jgi:hypothetical protein
VDLNIPQFLECGRGGNLVQSAVSIGDDDENGCTIIVPGFHRHRKAWWAEVVERKEDKTGMVHSVEHTDKRVDQRKYGWWRTMILQEGGRQVDATTDHSWVYGMSEGEEGDLSVADGD